MNTKTTAVKFTGRRAYYFSQMRWFPMPAAKAHLMLATGQAEDWTGREGMI